MVEDQRVEGAPDGTGSHPSRLALSEAQQERLIGIPAALRKERGWSGARSVGMVKLIEERIATFLTECRASPLNIKDAACHDRAY